MVRVETVEVNRSPDLVRKISYSSTLPGYDYAISPEAPYWHTRVVGAEWMRVDFDTCLTLTGLKLQASGLEGAKCWVQSFSVQVVRENGDVEFINDSKSFRGNTNAHSTNTVTFNRPQTCKGLLILPETAKNDVISLKLWLSYLKV
ncbi:Oidioi.mRNA.OKI2018_I69.chr1.g393.t1.cds [Oikopleura dioica]|uniref:Oidioi.mRNA.OKI2018_I69.chr1.g393.t1.cds n=1 Tax=Oikopleura dioica TaxID=34765 RepID=A0ABN7SNJ5_OIKDI|nr:Oidioi.mRNA.OKI2018_I69.chr1.g393.t1.cds [Oikopleura dioica]